MKISNYVSHEELKRLLSGLVVFAGSITIFGLFGFIVVPGLRNANKPAPSKTVAPVVGQWGWLDPTEYPPAKGYEIPPLDPKTVMDPTPELLERGAQLYAKNCQQCHGNEGRGDGPAAGSLTPKPRDFTSAEGWKMGYDRPGIFKVLSEGIAQSAMASFDYLRLKDRMALVHHVQSLGSFPRKKEAPAALDALAKQLARAGQKIPPKIPVSLAMEILAREFRKVPPLAVPPAGAEDGREGAGPLGAAVWDPARAALTLAGAPSWHKDISELARIVVAGAPSNGFSLRTATFSREQWKELQGELITRSGR